MIRSECFAMTVPVELQRARERSCYAVRNLGMCDIKVVLANLFRVFVLSWLRLGQNVILNPTCIVRV